MTFYYVGMRVGIDRRYFAFDSRIAADVRAHTLARRSPGLVWIESDEPATVTPREQDGSFGFCAAPLLPQHRQANVPGFLLTGHTERRSGLERRQHGDRRSSTDRRPLTGGHSTERPGVDRRSGTDRRSGADRRRGHIGRAS